MRLIVYFFVFCSASLVVDAIRLEKRIYRGRNADVGEFPHQGTVYVNGNYVCGCALVTKYHCITAAHCIEGAIRNAWTVTVMIGSINLYEGRVHHVRRLSHFPGFTSEAVLSGFYPHDIGMIYFVEAADLTNPNIALIGLPTPYSEVADETFYVSGFGFTGKDDPLSPRLMKLETEVQSLLDCQVFFEKQLDITQLCTMNSNGYGCYFGDAGNPLVDITKSTLIGVLSGITGTCGMGDPDVFTKVSHYMAYIKAEINYNPNNPRRTLLHPSINFRDNDGRFYPVPRDLERYTNYVFDY